MSRETVGAVDDVRYEVAIQPGRARTITARLEYPNVGLGLALLSGAPYAHGRVIEGVRFLAHVKTALLALADHQITVLTDTAMLVTRRTTVPIDDVEFDACVAAIFGLATTIARASAQIVPEAGGDPAAWRALATSLGGTFATRGTRIEGRAEGMPVVIYATDGVVVVELGSPELAHERVRAIDAVIGKPLRAVAFVLPDLVPDAVRVVTLGPRVDPGDREDALDARGIAALSAHIPTVLPLLARFSREAHDLLIRDGRARIKLPFGTAPDQIRVVIRTLRALLRLESYDGPYR